MQYLLNRIICGDCIEVLDKVDQPFADLIFADPPFNIGYKYDKYYDKRKRENYIAWTREWMAVCKKVLKPAGSFYIAIGDEYAANVRIIADELGLFLRNWIIWHYTFGQQTKNKFARSHTHIFYLVNDKKNFTFNDHAVRVPSDRQLIYNDRRANPAGKMPDDVWTEYSRVCGTFKERTGWHPCQMPESLLKRIIAASSNPGDCVLDPFCGSGTTPAAARRLDRDFAGIEISQQYVENARKRLAQRKKRCRASFLFNTAELNEIRRLLADMQTSPREITADPDILEVFAGQLTVRMSSGLPSENGGRQYRPDEIVTALKDLPD
jgi:site-specific DNA-methyltransferase (adenine-specific)